MVASTPFKNLHKLKEKKKPEPNKRTILLVDDEVETLRALSEMLKRDYHLLTALDGKEALDLVKNHSEPKSIQMIISDQRMPKMNGVRFLKETLSIIPQSIRIILTGHTDIEDIIDSINEGQIYKFLIKPIEPQDFLLTVKRGMELFALESQNDVLVQNLKELNASLENKVIKRTEQLALAHEQILILEKETTEQQMAGGFAHEMRNAISGAKLIVEHSLGMHKTFNQSIHFANIQTLKEIYSELENKVEEPLFSQISLSMNKVFLRESNLEKGLHVIYSSLSKALNITQKIMDYSIISKEIAKKEEVNINAIVELIVKKWQREFQQNQIAIHLQLSDEDAYIQGSRNHFFILIENLIINAKDALIEKKTPTEDLVLKVSSQIDNLLYLLEFQDNGLGIAEENKTKIYDPFFSTKPEKGIGLGLGFVKKIVTSYKGNLTIQSEENKGTIVTVELPLD